MIRAFSILFLMSLFNPTWAASLLEEHTDGTDASIAYLSMIFGVVDGVLHGGGSQIAGHLSSLLSTVIFLGAGILWAYTTFVGVLNTASEGQFLGQKWSSMWIPVRAMIGVCLLMPKGTTGYSLIQVIVMSIIIQGVHAANFAWHTTLDYLEKGGVIVESVRRFTREEKSILEKEPSRQNWKQDHSSLIDKAGQVLKSEVCMMTLYYAFEQQSRQNGHMPPLDFVSTLNLQGNYSNDNHTRSIQFPSVWNPGFCGTLEWNTYPQFKHYLPFQSTASDLSQVAMQLMVMNLLQPARHIATRIVSNTPKHLKGESIKENVSQFETNMPTSNMGINFDSDESYNFIQGANFTLFKTAESVMGLLKAKSRQENHIKKALEDVNFTKKKDQMKKAGWIVAGNYYALLARSNKVVSNIEADFSWLDRSIRVKEGDIKKVLSYLPNKQQRDNLTYFLDKEVEKFIAVEKDRARSYYEAPWITHESDSMNIKSSVNDLLSDPFLSSAQSFQKTMRSVLDVEKDPIIALSKVGSKLLQAVEGFWVRFNNKNINFSGLTDVSEFLKFAFLIPVIGTWMLLNFTIGSVLVYYVPLIPFLLFFFGSLTWFSLVIGAVLASPLVALGVMHPEGHDFFGQAEQATRLLAGLFLRPMLMVFGLVFGMILCTVIFELFHYGYYMMIPEINQFNGILSGVSQVAIVALYTTVAVSIVTHCFALIYEIPNKAFSWIGWQTEGHSSADILNQARSSLEQQISGTGQQTTSRVIQSSEAGSHSSQRSSSSAPDIEIRHNT